LQSHAFYIALPPGHPLSRLKAIPLEKAAAEPFIAPRRKDNPSYCQALGRLFGPAHVKTRVVVECENHSGQSCENHSGQS
jgi:hypothetical protein